MAKKEKKEKTKKSKKLRDEKHRSKRAARRAPEATSPYPDSDRTKDFLVKMLVVLCFITIGMMIYTIHYMRYVDAKAQTDAERAAAEAAASAPDVGTIWFSKPDGTFVGETGAPYTPGAPTSSQPPLPSASQQTPAPETPPVEGEAPPASATEAPPASVPQ